MYSSGLSILYWIFGWSLNTISLTNRYIYIKYELMKYNDKFNFNLIQDMININENERINIDNFPNNINDIIIKYLIYINFILIIIILLFIIYKY